MTPKQRAALELGSKIRMICCIDAQSKYLDPDLSSKVRELCDEQMHRLGYESITENRKRINNAFIDGSALSTTVKKFYKFQRYKKKI